MLDPKTVKILLILVISGAIGSALALIPFIFRKNEEGVRYGTAAGVGFLVGASIGGLFGVFAVLLEQI